MQFYPVSGSAEGISPTASGSNLAAALTAGSGIDIASAAPLGTWKLIKGKVTQTIEEIKSSKQQQHQLPAQSTAAGIPIIVAEAHGVSWSNEPDSDTDCITLNTSASEELPLDQDQRQHNSDSDIEAELLQHDSQERQEVAATSTGTGAITEHSRLRRGLAHIRSRVKAKQQQQAMSKKEASSSGAVATSLRGNFLRRRNVNADTAESLPPAQTQSLTQTDRQSAGEKRKSASTSEIPIASGKAKQNIVLARKDVEIESGVEVHEDMMPMTSAAAATEAAIQKRRTSLGLPLDDLASTSSVSLLSTPSKILSVGTQGSIFSSLSVSSACSWRLHHGKVQAFGLPILLLSLLFLLFVLPIHDFVRGVLATVLLTLLIDSCNTYLRWVIERYMLTVHPERTPFKIPDYSGMPICEIPAVEEHKTIKAYAGWLNEASSYDPHAFSFSLTRSIYVRLDGTILKMSGTNARIPKRRMWNEPPIDRTKVLFTDHRSYDLRHCRIELLPLGLAKKRFFNRKYPIQLIIKNDCSDRESASMQFEPQDTASNRDSKSNVVSGSTPSSLGDDAEKPIDFGATVLQADLQQLRNSVNPDTELEDITMPCGDEVRLLLFSRCDREKEDWYRRFVAASKGRVHEQDLQVPHARFVDDTDMQAAAARHAAYLTIPNIKPHTSRDDDENAKSGIQADTQSTVLNTDEATSSTPEFEDILNDDGSADAQKDEQFEGMIMNSDVTRNSPEYVRFMAAYQKACTQSRIPVRRVRAHDERSHHHHKKTRRAKRQEDELWRGIDQSLFLGPSGSIVWANVVLGRCLFSWLHDDHLHEKIKDFMQKKLNSIKLPSFMEEVVITNIYLGQSPVLFHRVSQPLMDERGVWLDGDITYEGLAHITVTTKLNLLRVRAKAKVSPNMADMAPPMPEPPPEYPNGSDNSQLDAQSTNASVIYDSDAESSGGSSSETESPAPGTANDNVAGGSEFFQNSPGNARRIFKIVDRITASNLFQYATELPYVQRAMENMSTNITLRVDLKGLVARGTLNMPPPPSDRVWLCFRAPPRLWISTKPQLGDKSVDWSIVTNVIESKLCEAVNKFLVYPNMVDFTIPFLSKPGYEDEPPTMNTNERTNC